MRPRVFRFFSKSSGRSCASRDLKCSLLPTWRLTVGQLTPALRATSARLIVSRGFSVAIAPVELRILPLVPRERSSAPASTVWCTFCILISMAVYLSGMELSSPCCSIFHFGYTFASVALSRTLALLLALIHPTLLEGAFSEAVATDHGSPLYRASSLLSSPSPVRAPAGPQTQLRQATSHRAR